jgi:predicted dehydrogenase
MVGGDLEIEKAIHHLSPLTHLSMPQPIRIAIYGAGKFANQTHLPNLKQIAGVDLVAVCDVNKEALQDTAARFGIRHTYTDAQTMLASETIDGLYSIVPAYVRTDVEISAALKGIHLFSEKPQALDMALARRIDDAIHKGGVISTVGFRERYRPIFQEAKRLLKDKRVVHARFQQIGPYPDPTKHKGPSWWTQMEKGGVRFFDWGVHATDYLRYMTGQDVTRSQAFICQPDGYHNPMSSSFHYQLSEGATANLIFIEADPTGLGEEPYFKIYFEGGRLAIFGYERIELNDEVVYDATPFNPWLLQDQTFIEAIRTNKPDLLLSDYHDGLKSLAPILAGWISTRQNGTSIDLDAFMNQ